MEPDAGQGNADIGVTLPPNGSTAQRLVSVVVVGQIVRLAQDGAPVKECKYGLNGTSRRFTAAGGGGGVDMRTAAGCAWGAESQVPWLRIVSGMKGTGDGTVTYTLEPNHGTEQRTGTLSAEGNIFTVIQQGIRCRYEVPRPAQTAFLASGGSASTTVTTAPPCSWDAVSDVPWITVTEGRIGNGTVAFTVAPNPEPADREGGVFVAGQRIPILQAGPCRYTVTNVRHEFGGTRVVWPIAVKTHPACSWTASSDVPWITPTTPLPVKGEGFFEFVLDANGTGGTRTGTLIVMDERVSILQTTRTDIPNFHGTVTNRVTQLPLAGASISVRGAGSADALTNASGMYSIRGLQAGSLTVTISAAGFVTQTWNLNLEGGRDSGFSVELVPSAPSSSSGR
nr:bacteroidetes-Associated Carbohydrate-binding Often N-terminal [uncultured bacterium]